MPPPTNEPEEPALSPSPLAGEGWGGGEPRLDYVWGRHVAYFPRQPRGVILHGTRSGQADRSVHQEFISTLGWVATGTDGVVGWNATGGEGEIGIHMGVDEWGWHARHASSYYLAYEFAQASATWDVTDLQVDTFCWWWIHQARWRWPALPLTFFTHAEVEAMGETGAKDGKTDVYPLGDPRGNELRARIVARL